MFPGSQAAGLVKRLEGSQVRRVLPAYYFRLPLPADFPAPARLELGDGQFNHAAYRRDPLGRFLYVVYLPNVERPGETIVLRWRPAEVIRAARPRRPADVPGAR